MGIEAGGGGVGGLVNSPGRGWSGKMGDSGGGLPGKGWCGRGWGHGERDGQMCQLRWRGHMWSSRWPLGLASWWLLKATMLIYLSPACSAQREQPCRDCIYQVMLLGPRIPALSSGQRLRPVLWVPSSGRCLWCVDRSGIQVGGAGASLPLLWFCLNLLSQQTLFLQVILF